MTNFRFRNKHYALADGLPMGSPASPVIANINIKVFEEKALATFPSTGPKVWFRFVRVCINYNYGTQACKQCIVVTAVLVYKYYNIPIMYNPYINLCMYIFNNVDHVSLPRRLGWFFKQWSSRSAALLKEVLSLHTSTKQKNFPLSVLQSTTAGWSHRTWRARLFFVEKDLLHSPRSHTKSFAAGDSTADRHDVDTA